MVAQVVNVGTQANDATGDLLRDAFTKINTNFAALFAGNFPAAQLTVGPPVSGNALTAIGISGSAAIVATAFSVTDISLTATGTASFAGGVTFGSPTGGNKGAGSFNAASGFINNVAVFAGTPVTTFTSNTGLSANVAATGAVTVTNTGVLSVTTNTGLSTNASATGAVTITNTGVVSVAGTASQIAVSASTGAVTLSLSPNVVLPAPPSGTTLAITGLANSNTVTITAPNTAGQSFGQVISAGTNNSDYTVRYLNAAGTATVFEIFGDGSGTLGPSITTGIGWSSAGGVTVKNPSSGIAFTITGSSAGIAAMTFNTMATTGAQSVTLAITNKPGASAQTTPAKWLPLNLDGTTYYVPAFL